MVVEYSMDEVSEGELDEMIEANPTFPPVDVTQIKRVKKSINITMPHRPTAKGLTESFIGWYKDHRMTKGLRRALE